ncbi:MAG: hypothetical protein D3924_19060 [Candidatus Electrothrix sp. AR4]|nr:hypothetical protein [Candidatus Electrothrix sp. AR4]
MNTEALVKKLRHSVTEVDSLLSGEEERRAEGEQRAKKKQNELDEKGKKWLAMIAEAVALPYYLYNLLAHALHLDGGWKWCLALAVTVLVTGTALRNTWLVMNGRKPWRILRRIIT